MSGPEITNLIVGTDHSVPIEPNGGSAVVTVDMTGGTVYYNNGPGVSATNNQGSIAPGGQATFTASAWIIGSGYAGVTVTVTSVYDLWANSGLPGSQISVASPSSGQAPVWNGSSYAGVGVQTADVIAPLATGVTATDDANLRAAVAATPVGGMLFIPNPSRGGQTKYKITATPLVWPNHIRVMGESLVELWASGGSGVTNTNGPGPGANSSTPVTVQAAAFAGVVIEQQTAATDVFQFSGAATSVHLENLCGTFAAAIADTNTGHVFNATPSTNYMSKPDSGLMGFTWKNCIAAAHDGNHYGFVFTNPLLGTTFHLRSYGGGGYLFVSNTALSAYGNLSMDHPYAWVYNAGTAHGFAMSAASTSFPGGLGLIHMTRPQAIAHNVVQAAATQRPVHESVGASVPQYNTRIGEDMENFGLPIVNASTTQVIAPALISETSGADSHYVFNTRQGYQALSSGVAAERSSAFGYQALMSLVTNSDNTAGGYQALMLATSAGNTAFGSGAGAALTTGALTAFGFGAAALLQTGTATTAIGTGALATAATVSQNTACGFNALHLTTVGNQTAVGASAGAALTTGSGNTIVGYEALAGGTTAAGTVAIGQDAGYKPAGTVANATVAGQFNTFVGYQTGINSTSDWGHVVAVGYQATCNGASAVSIGPTAAAGGTNAIALGSATSAGAAGAVAIGTDSTGAGATSTTANALVLGTANHIVTFANVTTGAGSAALGANSPAVTNTAPFTWVRLQVNVSGTLSNVFMPVWK